MRTPALLIIPAVFALAAAVAPVGPAWSAENDSPVTWSVSPADASGPDGRAWIEQTADPGTTLREHLAIRNLGESPATFTLTAADGYFTPTGRFNMLRTGEPSVNAGTWIEVQPEVSIEAGGTSVIPFTVRIPANATPGDHAAGIAASILSTGTTADGAQVGVESRVGFRVMTRVSGELAPALEVQDASSVYTTSWNPFSPGDLVVTYTAANTGNTQLRVADRIGGAGTERGDLLPGEQRTVTSEPLSVWPVGLVTVDVIVEGTVPAGGAAASPVRTSIVVWAIPWPHLLIVAGILLIIAAVFFGRRRSRARIERLLEEARADGRNEAELRAMQSAINR